MRQARGRQQMAARGNNTHVCPCSSTRFLGHDPRIFGAAGVDRLHCAGQFPPVQSRLCPAYVHVPVPVAAKWTSYRSRQSAPQTRHSPMQLALVTPPGHSPSPGWHSALSPARAQKRRCWFSCFLHIFQSLVW